MVIVEIQRHTGWKALWLKSSGKEKYMFHDFGVRTHRLYCMSGRPRTLKYRGPTIILIYFLKAQIELMDLIVLYPYSYIASSWTPTDI